MDERIIELYLILFYIMLNYVLTMCKYQYMTANFTRFLVSLVIFRIWFPLTVIMTLLVGHEPITGTNSRRRQIRRRIFEIPSSYRYSLDRLMEGIGKLVMFIWAKTRLKFSKKERLQKEWNELFYCGE
jgi:hypothetical protein